MRNELFASAILIAAISLAACGEGPATVAYTRGCYFQANGNIHYTYEDPLSKEGIDEYRKAIEQFNTAIRFKPKYADALKARAQCNERVKKYDQAIKDACEYIALVPGNVQGWKLRAAAYKSIEMYEQAAADLREVLSRAPKDADAMMTLAGLQYRLKQYDAGERLFKEALDVHPNNANVYVQQSLCRLRANRSADVEAALQKARELSPHSPGIYQDCGYCEFLAGKYKEANQDFHRAWALTNMKFRSAQYTPILGLLSCDMNKDQSGRELWIHLIGATRGIPIDTTHGARNREPDPQWPNAALQYVAADITEEKLLEQTQGQKDRSTEAHCYIGISKLVNEDKEGARKDFDWILAHGNKNYIEYDIAAALRHQTK